MGRAIAVECLLAGIKDSDGEPLAAGKVYSYEAGTTTPKYLYNAQSAGVGETHDNPAILNSVGVLLAYAYGNYKFVIKDSDDNTLYTWDDLQFGLPDVVWGGATSGSVNAYTLTPIPAINGYENGQLFIAYANFTNTAAATINVSGAGAKSIYLDPSSPTAIAAGDIQGGKPIILSYINDTMVLLNPYRQIAVAFNYATNIAGTNTITGTLPFPPSAYIPGMMVAFRSAGANTGAVTVNFNSIGAKALIPSTGGAYSGGEIAAAGEMIVAFYDGTSFVCVNAT